MSVPKSTPSDSEPRPSTYETDFYGWTRQQAELLRQGRLLELDAEHLLEEIDSMGQTERVRLTSNLEIVLVHLLKWHYQPSHRGNSWRLSIKEHRRRVHKGLQRNPSLKPELAVLLADAYETAVLVAARKTGLAEATFPSPCPWTLEQVLAEDYWPD